VCVRRGSAAPEPGASPSAERPGPCPHSQRAAALASAGRAAPTLRPAPGTAASPRLSQMSRPRVGRLCLPTAGPQFEPRLNTSERLPRQQRVPRLHRVLGDFFPFQQHSSMSAQSLDINCISEASFFLSVSGGFSWKCRSGLVLFIPLSVLSFGLHRT